MLPYVFEVVMTIVNNFAFRNEVSVDAHKVLMRMIY